MSRAWERAISSCGRQEDFWRRNWDSFCESFCWRREGASVSGDEEEGEVEVEEEGGS